MRWILSIIICVALGLGASAAGPDDEFVDIYNLILQAQNLETTSQTNAAALRYQQALTGLQQLQGEHPSWNPTVVKFRLEFLHDKLAALGKYLPAATNAAPPAAAPTAAVDPAAAWRAQVEALTAANTQLQEKLKEALSVQPSVSPADLAKAQEKITALQKENDLLSVTLEKEKSAKTTPAAETAPPADFAKLTHELAAATNQIAGLNGTVAELRQKLDDANSQVSALKSAPPAAPAAADLQQLTEERDHLKDELAQRTKDLAEAEAHAAQVKPPPAPAASDESARLGQEVAQLKDRIAVLEATPVPYTPEELEILKQPAATSPAQAAALAAAPPAPANAAAPAPAPTPATTPATAAAPPINHLKAHSSKDLPPGAGALMADASRLETERDFKAAEEKYNEILIQDENNVYVLAHLARTQFEAGELADCEKTVQRAVSIDPDDPASLYLLGILRYRQEKLDEALDALSRSARANPTNVGTQNFLGCVLADKGLRPAAETAFRKALQLDPEYGDAHFNLAFVYATEKPPSLALARWHYKRASDLGHPRSEQLEKLLAAEK